MILPTWTKSLALRKSFNLIRKSKWCRWLSWLRMCEKYLPRSSLTSVVPPPCLICCVSEEERRRVTYLFICCWERETERERERERQCSLWSDCVLTLGLICLQLGPVSSGRPARRAEFIHSLGVASLDYTGYTPHHTTPHYITTQIKIHK